MSNLVSILLPIYNGEKFLRQSIESVLFQTYINFKLLIYNDGSTDDTLNIIKSFHDNRIKIFNSDTNKGIVHALNFLIEQSQGKYIARMDADDIWYPQKLSSQIIFMQNNPQYGLVACWARFIDENGKTLSIKNKQYTHPQEIIKFLPSFNFIIHSSVLIKKDIFNIVGKYRTKYLHTEDYDLWLRLLEKNIPIAILPQILLDYRIWTHSINFKYRKLQYKNVIRLKIEHYRNTRFKWKYLFYFSRDLYYLIIPDFILLWKIKHKI